MPRKLRTYSSKRKLNFKDPTEISSGRGSIQGDSKEEIAQSSTKDVTPAVNYKSQVHPKVYKLREPTNIIYFEDGNDTDDFSPDCSEYNPSPDRIIPDSRSTSSLGVDSQDLDTISNRNITRLQEQESRCNSSLGGDSILIDSFFNSQNITKSPSAVSNLSLILGETDFVASPDVIYKRNAFNSHKGNKKRQDTMDFTNKENDWPNVVDISLKPVNNQKLALLDHTVTANKSTTAEDLDKTLTPTKFTNPDPIITNSELNQEKQKVKKSFDKETDYILTNYKIEITIEEEYPETLNSEDQPEINVNPKSLLNNQINEQREEVRTENDNPKQVCLDSSEIEIDFSSIKKKNNQDHAQNKNQTDNATNQEKECDLSELLPKESGVLTHKNQIEDAINKEKEIDVNTIFLEETEEPSYKNLTDGAANQQKQYDIEEVFLEKSEENLIDQESNEVDNPLDLDNEPNISSVDSENERISQHGVPVHAISIPVEIPAANDVIEPITNDSDSQISETENQDEDQPQKLTRKRKRDPSEWRDFKNKRLKNSGQAYEGARSKKQHEKKTVLPNCTCKKNCGLKFSTEQRQALHAHFYKLSNREYQWQYITRHVKSDDVKKITVNRKNNRTQTLKYYFPLNNEETQVCKVFFLNTLSITEQIIYTALEKIKRDESFIDQRGMHLNRPHRMNPSTEASIKRHIDLFPKVESHYTRKESKREYLAESLNISKMYRIYKCWFTKQNYSDDVQMASKRQYEKVFNTQYNYSFFKPKKDQCSLCSQYQQADPIEKAALEENYNRHLKLKERVREIKKEEKETLNKDDSVVAIFDLEKVLTVPQSEVSIFHYKRKYPIYNFTVFDAINRRGFCYVWHAQIGKKGCKEIGSCLLQFIKTMHEKGIRNIKFYSDGCYGQNKNRYIFALYLYVALILQIDITHRFFVSGHSQNEGDSMHARIEKNMKNQVLYTPDQVYSVIMNAKVSGEKYILKEMQQSEIFDIKELVEPKRWLKDKTGEKVRWAEVMEVSVSHTKPNCILFKYDFDEEYSELDYDLPAAGRNRQRRGQAQQRTQKSIENIELKPAYDEPIPISKALYDDLQSLCTSQAIPHHYQPFYKNLHFSVSTSGGDDESD